jgi:hypothetical protein
MPAFSQEAWVFGIFSAENAGAEKPTANATARIAATVFIEISPLKGWQPQSSDGFASLSTAYDAARQLDLWARTRLIKGNGRRLVLLTLDVIGAGVLAAALIIALWRRAAHQAQDEATRLN